jgi:hypothetical protein
MSQKITLTLSIITFILTLFSASTSQAQTRLRVMTYNMHGIVCIKRSSHNGLIKKVFKSRCPDNTYWSQTIDERFDRLVNILNNLNSQGRLPDVLLVQEAFTSKINIMDNGPIDRLIAHSPYRYIQKGPSALVKTIPGAGLSYLFHSKGVTDAGLLIMSKHPIVAKGQRAFDTCRPEDCLARKGVAFARIRLPSQQTVDILTTHHQAGGVDDVRIRQNSKATTFMGDIEDSVGLAPWMIYGGDFNFRNTTRTPSFNDFMAKTKMDHMGLQCLETLGCSWSPNVTSEQLNGIELDHFFARARPGHSINPAYIEYGQYSFNDRALTDHPYLIVDYLLR